MIDFKYTFKPVLSEEEYRAENDRRIEWNKPSILHDKEDFKENKRFYIPQILLFFVVIGIDVFCVKEEARVPFMFFLIFIVFILLVLRAILKGSVYAIHKTVAQHKPVDMAKFEALRLDVDVKKHLFIFTNDQKRFSLIFTSNDIDSWGIDVQSGRVAGIRLKEKYGTYSDTELKWSLSVQKLIELYPFGKKMCEFLQQRSVELSLSEPIMLNTYIAYQDYILYGIIPQQK